nr:hypothetical protein [Tanacetum cinerariifolium]
ELDLLRNDGGGRGGDVGSGGSGKEWGRCANRSWRESRGWNSSSKRGLCRDGVCEFFTFGPFC